MPMAGIGRVSGLVFNHMLTDPVSYFVTQTCRTTRYLKSGQFGKIVHFLTWITSVVTHGQERWDNCPTGHFSNIELFDKDWATTPVFSFRFRHVISECQISYSILIITHLYYIVQNVNTEAIYIIMYINYVMSIIA